MKKTIALLFSFTFISNSFGMSTKTSSIRKIALHQKTRSFHTSKPAHMEPLGAGAWVMAFFNTWSIYDANIELTKLNNRVKQLEETIKQSDEKYNALTLKLSEQSKNDTTQLKVNQE